jgi:hypothetical protein
MSRFVKSFVLSNGILRIFIKSGSYPRIRIQHTDSVFIHHPLSGGQCIMTYPRPDGRETNALHEKVFDNPTPVPESTTEFLSLVSKLAVRHPAVVAQVVLDVHLHQRCQRLARFSGQFDQKKMWPPFFKKIACLPKHIAGGQKCKIMLGNKASSVPDFPTKSKAFLHST